MMLTKSNHTRPGRRYPGQAMALPLLLLSISAFTLRPVYTAHGPLHRAATPVSVVIDAGHGGIDPGAQVDGVKEKDLTLALAMKVNELAPQYNVHVTLTRNSDALPGNTTDIREGLKKRVEITEQEKAALFISLHVNVNIPITNPDHAGFEAYIGGRPGEVKDPKSSLLASILLEQLGHLYTTAPNIIQHPNKNIWVLNRNVCPAVMLECGNLSNPADVAFITNKDNQEKVARTILEGIVQFTK